ncbi:hypothetical protein L211DRAFT_257259 [Terfezia boudieri ATCC MYA-4762]|uniref:Uncharacterized protein n=1 Tax=Terfezia boudieri ATCC MYA-4762 TaxID=1051890 RepID=A0A3N4M1P2_9PEZI|nr:hypothetical protein L211DRAFT_257259 [Terfezia boudieri ATCC MYA-4762]
MYMLLCRITVFSHTWCTKTMEYYLALVELFAKHLKFPNNISISLSNGYSLIDGILNLEMYLSEILLQQILGVIDIVIFLILIAEFFDFKGSKTISAETQQSGQDIRQSYFDSLSFCRWNPLHQTKTHLSWL